MKKSKPTSRDRVLHAIEAIENIQEFASPHSPESFFSDLKTTSACLFQFSIVGEATFNIDFDILEKYDYPWHRVKSFRNYILHEYHGIEMKVVWDTIQRVLPQLKIVMEQIMANEFD